VCVARTTHASFIDMQGFISVNGCSLTVGPVEGNTFQVWLIPETLRATTFGGCKVGDSVNIELDAQTVATVDTVIAFMSRGGAPLTAG